MRLYYGTYGHHLSGKLYVYWGDDNLRTGQQVVAPVTNKKSGRTYNTMFTIGRTSSEKNAAGEVDRLSQSGIFVKTLIGTDVLTLPGAKPFQTKTEWKRESETRYRQKHNLPEPAASEKTKSRAPKSDEKTLKTPQKKKTKKKKKNKLKKSLGKNIAASAAGLEAAKAALKRGGKSAADSFQQKERLKKNIRARSVYHE